MKLDLRHIGMKTGCPQTHFAPNIPSTPTAPQGFGKRILCVEVGEDKNPDGDIVWQEGFDSLGYHFKATQRGRLTRWPREKGLIKLWDTIRAKTKRTNGNSLEYVILDLNCRLPGWFATSNTVVAKA